MTNMTNKSNENRMHATFIKYQVDGNNYISLTIFDGNKQSNCIQDSKNNREHIIKIIILVNCS